MNLGAEPKKVAILVGLLVVAGVVLYINVFQGDSGASAPRPVAVAAPAPVAATAPAVAASPMPLAPDSASAPGRRREQKNGSVSEFKPRQGYARPEDKPDPATVDPNLRLDLLAKVQGVELAGASRNVFQYGAAVSTAKPVELPKNPPTIAINNKPPVTAPPSPVTPSGPPPPPAAPAMTFKYYGFKVSKRDGHKEAFLLDGDDIIIVAENETVKKGRYRVVRINLTSIEVEDTQFRSTQTLKLQEDAAV